MPNVDIDRVLERPAPASIAEALQDWPLRVRYWPSPRDWRDEVFYFLLVDRFSDDVDGRKQLPADLSTPAGVAAVRSVRPPSWSWERWNESGAERFQGGTLRGVKKRLGYLADLGVTTLWLSPVFRQRVEENTYHGYGIQNFLEVDPRLGTRADLRALVDEAHSRSMRVVLDVIVNHCGCNFLYDASAGNVWEPPYKAEGYYSPTWPRSGMGHAIQARGQALGPDDFTLPSELRQPDCYMCAGMGDLGAGDVASPTAAHKRSDFHSLRKFQLDYRGTGATRGTLESLIIAHQYWIAAMDVDGFRCDTVKHLTFDQARDFCNGVKEFAESIGKDDLFLVAEVGGGDPTQHQYLEMCGRNLNACLDIAGQRETICNVAKGLAPARSFFDGFNFEDGMGSHRNWGSRHLVVVQDHDQLVGRKIRFAAGASNDHQAAAAHALALFGLGIPCLYYGTEQGFASGAESADAPVPCQDWGLREAMFGPEHPRKAGNDGVLGQTDPALPGFGPHGTAGYHAFDPDHPIYTRTKLMTACRAAYSPLRRGRQYQRNASRDGGPLAKEGNALAAWSRVFDDQEVLVAVNVHGLEDAAIRVEMDERLSSELKVVCCTDPSVILGTKLAVSEWAGRPCVALPRLGCSEAMVLVNREAETFRSGRTW